MSNQDSPKGKALVIGALSFLGAHVVFQLVEQGYYVRGTVRSKTADVEMWTAHLKDTTKFSEGSFEIVEADILRESGWEELFQDIDYVFFIAFPHSSANLPKDIVDATERLLILAQKSISLKKFVLTSCYSALADAFENDKAYSETDWNENATWKRNIYAFSKARAEKRAMKISQKANFQFVSFVPGILLGPPIIPRLSYSHEYIKVFLDGTANKLIDLHYPIADVRDVARAHLNAIQSAAIVGRYCLSQPAMSIERILYILHQQFPHLKVPSEKAPKLLAHVVCAVDKRSSGIGNFAIQYNGQVPYINCQKAFDIGMTLNYRIEDTIEDTTQYFMENYILEALPGTPMRRNCVLS